MRRRVAAEAGGGGTRGDRLPLQWRERPAAAAPLLLALGAVMLLRSATLIELDRSGGLGWLASRKWAHVWT